MSVLGKLDHIALIVRDPARTAAFFADVFGAKALRGDADDEHPQTFVELGGAWFVLIAAEVERAITGDHLAFQVEPEAIKAAADNLAARGHEFQLGRGDTALYFQDFDSHVFELTTVGVESELPA